MIFNVAELLDSPSEPHRTSFWTIAIPSTCAMARRGSSAQLPGTRGCTAPTSPLWWMASRISPVLLECSRCLTEFTTTLDVPLRETFYPSIDIETGLPVRLPEDETAFTIDDHHQIDLREAIRQNLVLALPIQPLCLATLEEVLASRRRRTTTSPPDAGVTPALGSPQRRPATASGAVRVGPRIGRMSHILSAVAWPYANGPRHIGHVAGFGVPSDVFSRYMRMAGNDVLMVSGTDEHGTPILVQAENEGVSPLELADRYNRVIAEDLTALGLSYDLFTRTTTATTTRSRRTCSRPSTRTATWCCRPRDRRSRRLRDAPCPDRYIEGTCPICGFDGRAATSATTAGTSCDPIDLKNPKSRINGETPQFIDQEHFFLDLPALAPAIADWLGARDGWRPNVLNFSRNLLADVRPRAMTRDIDWGIPVPLPGWEDNPNKRLYVWFDAVIGYLSASIEWARRTGDPDAWRAWWNDPRRGRTTSWARTTSPSTRRSGPAS